MPSAAEDLHQVSLSATAGELGGNEPFFVGQSVHNNDAGGIQDTAALAEDTRATAEVSPGLMSPETPAQPTVLFAGTGGLAQGSTPTQTAGGGAVVAALKGEVLACTKERLRELFKWQGDHGVAGKSDFMEECVMSHSGDIVSLGCVQKDSTAVKLIHGVTKYMGRDAPELKKSVVGRVGEWTHDNKPHLVELPPQKTWDWKEIEFADDFEAWKNFVNNALAEDKFKLYTPSAGASKKKRHLPYMPYFPPPLALYAVERERTCFELYVYTKTMVDDPDSGIEQEHAEMLMDYFMAAGQATGTGAGAHKSSLQENFKAVISFNPGFVKWSNTHMSAYLGQPPLGGTPQQAQSASFAASHNALMQSSVKLFNDMSKQQSKALEQQEQKKKSNNDTLMSEYAMAALMGFANVTSWKEIPCLYPVLRTVKDNTEARDKIMQGMAEWGLNTKNEISPNVFLPEDLIKNIRAVKPNPTGIVGTSRVSDVEMTNLACLPLSATQIEARMIGEQAAHGTETNRTQAQKEKQLKGEPRSPPNTYYGVKLNVATTAALVSVCYGERNKVYTNLLNILQILKSTTVMQASMAFTPLFCRQICWAIIDDMKTYFSKRLLPDDFKKGYIEWPQSFMEDIFSNINFQTEIQRRTFPYAWMLPANTDTNTQGDNGGIGGTTGGRGRGRGRGGADPWGTNGYSMGQPPPARQQAPYLPPPPPGYSPYVCPPADAKLGHLHPKIKTLMAEYHKLVKRHQVNVILSRAGITQNDLPIINQYVNQSNRSTLCWNHLTGECFFGVGCMFVAGHVPGVNLPDGFVDESVKKLKPGVDAIVKDLKAGLPKAGEKRPGAPPGSSYYGPGGGDSSNKRR